MNPNRTHPVRRSEYEGDGRRQPHPLRDTYSPVGDDEGATFAGLLTRAEQERIRRAEDD